MSELSPGTILSHYRIINRIGAGGMGEVYQAQDIELGRLVALKFLSGEVSARESNVARFIQEAKAASSLNHPNIITVFEIGRSDNHTFIVTEFVDGLTLRQRLRLERLKLGEILDVATQVASALVAAHAAGIVHRDIKPENIMVRSDGIVKILDFGLAKLVEIPRPLAGPEESTIAMVNTEPGTVIGTTAYMSPEQAIGHAVDARTDIWSLGVVLYEMITARVPFTGASKSHVIVAISDQEPTPVVQLAPEVPQALEWIIAEAMTKDPEERCQTAKEMLGKLRRLKQRVESGALPTSPSDLAFSAPPHSSTGPTFSRLTTMAESVRATSPSSLTSEQQAISSLRKSRKYLLLLGLLLVTAVGFALYKYFNQPKVFGPIKMTALTTGGKLSGEDINGQLSISPDGKYVVCTANDLKQQASLWIRQISTNSLVRLVPAENGAYLSTTFSPDGEFVYYVASLERNKYVPSLYRIPVLGGTPTKILEGVDSPISFSQDGAQFAFVRKQQNESSLVIANRDGDGETRTLATLRTPDEFSVSGPAWSPDGKRIVLGSQNGGKASVQEVSTDNGARKAIGSFGWTSVGRMMWLADGSGLIMSGRTFSGSAGTQIWLISYPSGEVRRITNDLNGYGEVSLGLTADSGTIATIQQINSSSIWISHPNKGQNEAVQILRNSVPESVAWTPDGRVVYSSRTGENWDIWISSKDGSDIKQLTNDRFADQQPTVSPDGRYVVFQSDRSGARNLWRIDIDGTNAKQITSGNDTDAAPVCTSDGRSVLFQSTRSGRSTILKVDIDGGKPTELTDSFAEFPSLSPDGKLISYFHQDPSQDKQPKLTLIAVEGGPPVNTVTLPRSVQPLCFAWMPDGKSIAYLDNSSGILNVWSQPLDGGPPKRLTNFNSEFITSFAIAKDGTIATYRFSATRDIVLIKDFR